MPAFPGPRQPCVEHVPSMRPQEPGQCVGVLDPVFFRQGEQAADVQRIIVHVGEHVEVGDICGMEVDLQSGAGGFATRRADGFGGEVDTRRLPAMTGQGYGVRPGAASQIQRFSGRGTVDEFHYLGRSDLRVPRGLPAPIAPLEFPAVGDEWPDQRSFHSGTTRFDRPGLPVSPEPIMSPVDTILSVVVSPVAVRPVAVMRAGRRRGHFP